jgi:hypothetical protein
MITLKCGCQVTEEGKFIVGERCRKNNCYNCITISEQHPFGDKRLTH